MANRSRFLVLRLAISDIRHEWVLNLCLVFALAAVIAPLLLIFGLKHGTIETLRSRLIEDPVKREIRPLETLDDEHGTDAWFRELSARPDVAFLIPMTRSLSNSVLATAANAPHPLRLEIAATAQGDPLLISSRQTAPARGEIVLGARAAAELAVQVGAEIDIVVEARDGGVDRSGRTKLRVAGVLEQRATTRVIGFIPVGLLQSFENYKDGESVPELNWTGRTPLAAPAYDGAVVCCAEPLGEELRQQLLVNTGLGYCDPMKPEELRTHTGWGISVARHTYLLYNENAPIGDDSLAALHDKLRGHNADVFPWVRPMEVELLSATGKSEVSRLVALPASNEQATKLGITPKPPWADNATIGLLLPAKSGIPAGPITLSHGKGRLLLRIPLTPSVTRAGDFALAPVAFLAALRRGELRPIRFENGLFLNERQWNRSFRLYTRTIDDVEPLRQYFEGMGIHVATQADRILEVVELDRQLSRVFWLIAAVGVAGGVAALIASLFASVERKRRELSVLRLLGVARLRLTAFPIYQSICLAGFGFALAATLYQGIAFVIQIAFHAQLRVGESFCRLAPSNLLLAAAASCGLASGAALLAAVRVSRAQPADALRED